MFTRRSWSLSRAPASARSPLVQDQAAALDAEAAPGGAALPRAMSLPAGTGAPAAADKVVQRARRRRRVARWLIAAVVLLAALAIGLAVLWRQNQRLGDDRAFVELVKTRGAKVSELRAADPSLTAYAKLAYDPTGRAVLIASNLPNVPQGRAYQLWFIVGNKPPVPGKTFVPDSAGNAVLNDEMPRDAVDADIFAITVEPAGGSSAPTSPIYLRSF